MDARDPTAGALIAAGRCLYEHLNDRLGLSNKAAVPVAKAAAPLAAGPKPAGRRALPSMVDVGISMRTLSMLSEGGCAMSPVRKPAPSTPAAKAARASPVATPCPSAAAAAAATPATVREAPRETRGRSELQMMPKTPETPTIELSEHARALLSDHARRKEERARALQRHGSGGGENKDPNSGENLNTGVEASGKGAPKVAASGRLIKDITEEEYRSLQGSIRRGVGRELINDALCAIGKGAQAGKFSCWPEASTDEIKGIVQESAPDRGISSKRTWMLLQLALFRLGRVTSGQTKDRGGAECLRFSLE